VTRIGHHRGEPTVHGTRVDLHVGPDAVPFELPLDHLFQLGRCALFDSHVGNLLWGMHKAPKCANAELALLPSNLRGSRARARTDCQGCSASSVIAGPAGNGSGS